MEFQDRTFLVIGDEKMCINIGTLAYVSEDMARKRRCEREEDRYKKQGEDE